MRAIDRYGVSDQVSPLFAKGRIIDIVNVAHPYDLSRTAKRVVAAYEYARCGDIETTAGRLAEMGIGRSETSAARSLGRMAAQMDMRGVGSKVYLHVTWNCQLKCRHCYASAHSAAHEADMRVEDIVKIAAEAHQCGFAEIVMTGGEPLMHRDLPRLLAALSALRQKDHTIRLALRTNLSLPLTLADWVRLSRAFDRIVVSLDGDKAHHDLRRGDGSYDAIVGNLTVYSRNRREILVQCGGVRPAALSLASAFSPEDIQSGQGRHVKAVGDEFGIRHVTMRPILPLGSAGDGAKPLKYPAHPQNEAPWVVLKRGFTPQKTCGIGEELYIEPSGDVFPCYAYHKEHAKIGNAVQTSVAHIMASPAFLSYCGHSVDTNAGCKTCEYRYLCGGLCKAWEGERAQYDLDAAPTNCGVRKESVRRLYEAALAYLNG